MIVWQATVMQSSHMRPNLFLSYIN